MKNLHLSIPFIFVCIFSMLIMSPAYAQNDSTFKYDPTLQYGSKPQTPPETPEQLHKKLVNARDAISNIMGSKMGNIPFNEVGIDEINSTLDVGIDSVKATLSEEQYLQKIKAIVGDIPIKITFEHITSLPLVVNASMHGNDTYASIPSPLKQLEAGTNADQVKCNQGFQLIFKQENMFPLCVKPDTSKILIERGWASPIIGISFGSQYTSKIPDLPVLFMPCDTPFSQSDTGVAVLYMPTNSIGKICVRYYNVNDTPTGIGMRIFEANNLAQNASDVTAWTDNSILEGNANKTIVYFIKTGAKVGFYGASLNCGGFPLAVGYNATSTITASDFPWIGKTFHCGVITYDSHIEGTTGIGIKYIPYP